MGRLLLAFADQQQQALRDALITGVAYELADGLGNKLGVAYQTTIIADCKTSIFTSKLPAGIDRLIGFANATSHADSDASKYFFANATRDGTEPVSGEAKLILTDVNGTTNVFGRAYGPGSGKANPFGNSRPFQTEPHFTEYPGKDFCGSETTNTDNLQHLAANPAYPSGHTVYGYIGVGSVGSAGAGAVSAKMVTRAAEYGNDRIVLGSHYAMDVLAGRTLALYDLAQLAGQQTRLCRRRAGRRGDWRISRRHWRMHAPNWPLLSRRLAAARSPTAPSRMKAALPTRRRTAPLRSDFTQTYGLPVVFANNAQDTEDVAKLAPEAGDLLTAAFPSLSTLAQADVILSLTEGPGSGFLEQRLGFRGLFAPQLL